MVLNLLPNRNLLALSKDIPARPVTKIGHFRRYISEQLSNEASRFGVSKCILKLSTQRPGLVHGFNDKLDKGRIVDLEVEAGTLTVW